MLRQTLQFIIRFAAFAEIGPSFVVVRPFSARNAESVASKTLANISSYVFVIPAGNRHRFYRVVEWQLLVSRPVMDLYWWDGDSF